MPDRLPDFLGIGTQKGGTTSLHQWLSKHEKVYLPECKEIHYFDEHYEKGKQWYSKHFRNSNTRQTCGEITPMYLYHPEAPQRIKKLLPDAKLIALLRDPAERTISQILHARQRKFETLGPREALAAENARLKSGNLYSRQKHSYISRSKYIEQLERYEQIFSNEQILVLKSEDLFLQETKAYERLLTFLGLEIKERKGTLPKANGGQIDKTIITEELRESIRSELIETAKNVREKYGFGWDWA